MDTAIPWDNESELLGAILGGFRDLPALSRVVSGDDFSRPEHEWIWDAAQDVHAAGLQPDPVTVKAHLAGKALKLPGGPLYLTELRSLNPFQAMHYAELVRKDSVRRKVGAAGHRLIQASQDPDVDPESLIARCREWVGDLDQSRSSDCVTTWDAVAAVLDIADRGQTKAASTPWPSLDELLVGGWQPGHLITVGARTGVGKSIFLENIATDMARRHGRRVLYVSMEMSAAELTQRTMAHTARVELSRIIRGGSALSPEDRDSLDRAAQIVGQTPVTFRDRSTCRLPDIRSAAWAVKQEAVRNGEQFGMVVVDYLQQIQPRDLRQNRQQQIGEFSRGLKQLAGELEVPVVAAAQLNRLAATRSSGVPMLSDLREAGDIEQDSNTVILLHEEMIEDGGRELATGEVEVIVAKQRSGSTGVRKLQKYGHYARFADPHRN